MDKKIPIPDSSTILTLGIISIVTSTCCFIFFWAGLIVGILAIVMANKAMSRFNENPGKYTEKSYSNVSAGKICAIIGIVLAAIWLLIMFVPSSEEILKEIEEAFDV
jgi:hypothetical protein